LVNLIAYKKRLWFGKLTGIDKADDVFVLQNGFYSFNGKWKQRGLGKLDGKEIEHLETFEKDGRLYYRFIALRNTRLIIYNSKCIVKNWHNQRGN
jgi:hypothetical protein